MSSVRQRGASASATNIDNDNQSAEAEKDNTRRSALSQALTSTANLANLLPTGTLLAFQILTPVFTQQRRLRLRYAHPYVAPPSPPRALLLPRLLH
ncbi:Protein DMP [Sesbania bispinosa]|nr:Protein DMP [Sesbania bispinosa]